MSDMVRDPPSLEARGRPGSRAGADRGLQPNSAPAHSSMRGGKIETELKLAIDPGDVARLLQHSMLYGVAAAPEALSSVYFDTPERKLWKAGLSLRVRRIGSRHIQTIKASAPAANDHFGLSRIEWEHDIGGGEPDRSLFGGTPLEEMIGADELLPLFETRVERVVRTIGEGDSFVEVSIDRGEIRAGDRRLPVSEIEIESKSGDVRRVFDMALSLCRTLPLCLMTESKSARGYELADGHETSPGKARRVSLSAGLSVKAAFHAVGQECLRHLAANISPLREATDETALHQLRVAIRRLRAAMSLFNDVLQDPESGEVKSQLKEMASLFGEARNLEVFAAEVARLISENPHEPGFRDLYARLDARKDEAYRRARYTASSPGFHHTLLHVAQWLAVGSWTNGDGLQRVAPEPPIVDLAAAEMTRRRKAIMRAARDVDGLDTAALHKLRIQVKKLRYACEFFDALFRHKKRKKAYLAGVIDLQTALGRLNDLTVQRSLVFTLAPSAAQPGLNGDDTGFAAGFVRGLQVSHGGPLRKAAKKKCARFRAARPFWRERRSP